jgi:hypothetical protein
MPEYVRTELRPGGFAVVWLQREPVNLMDLTMWQQLAAALDELEANEVRLMPQAWHATSLACHATPPDQPAMRFMREVEDEAYACTA